MAPRRPWDFGRQSSGADKVTSNSGDLDRSSDVEDADGYDLSCRLSSRTRAPTSAQSIVQLHITLYAWAVAASEELCKANALKDFVRRAW